MPLQVVCSACNAKLKAPDTAAGKKTKCPKCQAVIAVPVDAPQAPATSSVVKKVENWHMQTTDGSQFGPVPKPELDEWFKEGRISADCQLLKEGADQWQWASEVYPSLEQPAPIAPANKTGFEFLGPATPASNDPLGLGNAGLMAAPLPGSSLQSLAPAAPSFGGAPAYGVASYSAPANPYSSPAALSYNAQYNRRSGLHPMVIVASIIEFLIGAGYVLMTIGALVMMIFFLIGGAAIAANVPQGDPNAQGAMAVIAGFSGLGALCMAPFVLISLLLSILMIYTGVGLLKKRFWAKIVAIVVSILQLMPQLLFLFLSVLNFDPCNLLGTLVGVALSVTVLVAMLIPDCTSDFT